ncbi:MAG: hypothetical protein CMJ91_02930 [Planctomycetes bacterium]|nr:hypothetical protein [Planctomycetota bacterium]
MKRLSLLLFCIFCVSNTPLAAADEGRDIDAGFGEWKVLFDGKTTAGWQNAKPKRQAGGKNLWAVEDGSLANIRGGVNDICTVDEFTDYELEIEYKIPAKGNSGVYLRGTCEVQIFDSFGKADKDLSKADAGAIYGVGYVALKNAQKKPGEWNKYRILHVGHRITVWHNGVLIQDNVFQDQFTGSAMVVYPRTQRKLTADKGPIMLQGDHGKVWYRNIRIRPLCTAKGWTPLWNGKDLSEFTAKNDRRAKKGLLWAVEDHAFTNTSAGGGGHDIWTKASFGNFLVMYQYRAEPKIHGGNSGFYLRDQWEIQIHGPRGGGKRESKHGDGALYSYFPPARLSNNGKNRWNTMCVKLVDNKITVWQNGILIHDNTTVPSRTDNHRVKPPVFSKKPFKLQGDHGKVWFTNMKILPLPDSK